MNTLDLRELQTDGFKILPSVISEESCDQIIAALQPATANNLRQPHLRIPQILDHLASSSIAERLTPPWRIIRSIFFDKTSKANWSVPCHQDLTICVRELRDAPGFGPWSIKDGLHHAHAPDDILNQITTIRLHLDDCGPENGALRVLAGSHKHGRMTEQEIEAFRNKHNEVICSVPKGGALLMKPLLLHASSRATKPSHRRVLHFEVTKVKLPFGLEWI